MNGKIDQSSWTSPVTQEVNLKSGENPEWIFWGKRAMPGLRIIPETLREPPARTDHVAAISRP